MAKGSLSASISTEVLSLIDQYRQAFYPHLSQSDVVETLLRDALKRVVIPGGGIGFIDVELGADSREKITQGLEERYGKKV